MTFESWWASITDAEKRILTENYARYIWNVAAEAGRREERALWEMARLGQEIEDKFIDSQQQNLIQK